MRESDPRALLLRPDLREQVARLCPNARSAVLCGVVGSDGEITHHVAAPRRPAGQEPEVGHLLRDGASLVAEVCTIDEEVSPVEWPAHRLYPAGVDFELGGP